MRGTGPLALHTWTPPATAPMPAARTQRLSGNSLNKKPNNKKGNTRNAVMRVFDASLPMRTESVFLPARVSERGLAVVD